MFEAQYNDEMESEVKRLEARQRAIAAGHPEWANACAACGVELKSADVERCVRCGPGRYDKVRGSGSTETDEAPPASPFPGVPGRAKERGEVA
jgi:hypothetical protein